MEIPAPSVTVVVKARPALPNETSPSKSHVTVLEADSTVLITEQRGSDSPREVSYQFDSVFNEKATNAVLCQQAVEPIVRLVVDGENATVLTYGARGSGKTRLMSGTETDPGIVEYTVRALFRALHAEPPGMKTVVAVSYFELFGTSVRDLLRPDNRTVAIVHDKRLGPRVSGATKIKVESWTNVKSAFETGNERRTMDVDEELGYTSHRGHAILEVVVERSIDPTAATSLQGVFQEFEPVTCRLLLVDLAGVDRSGAGVASTSRSPHVRPGLVQQQSFSFPNAGSIRDPTLQSLTALTTCITALSDANQQRKPPFGSSRLTEILYSSLVGDHHLLFISTIGASGSVVDETYHTLKYAKRAKFVKRYRKLPRTSLGELNEDELFKNMLVDLKREITSLKTAGLVDTSGDIALPEAILSHDEEAMMEYFNDLSRNSEELEVLVQQLRQLEETARTQGVHLRRKIIEKKRLETRQFGDPNDPDMGNAEAMLAEINMKIKIGESQMQTLNEQMHALGRQVTEKEAEVTALREKLPHDVNPVSTETLDTVLYSKLLELEVAESCRQVIVRDKIIQDLISAALAQGVKLSLDAGVKPLISSNLVVPATLQAQVEATRNAFSRRITVKQTTAVSEGDMNDYTKEFTTESARRALDELKKKKARRSLSGRPSELDSARSQGTASTGTSSPKTSTSGPAKPLPPADVFTATPIGERQANTNDPNIAQPVIKESNAYLVEATKMSEQLQTMINSGNLATKAQQAQQPVVNATSQRTPPPGTTASAIASAVAAGIGAASGPTITAPGGTIRSMGSNTSNVSNASSGSTANRAVVEVRTASPVHTRSGSPSAQALPPSVRSGSPSAQALPPSVRSGSPSAQALPPSTRAASPSAQALPASIRAASPSPLRGSVPTAPQPATNSASPHPAVVVAPASPAVAPLNASPGVSPNTSPMRPAGPSTNNNNMQRPAARVPQSPRSTVAASGFLDPLANMRPPPPPPLENDNTPQTAQDNAPRIADLGLSNRRGSIPTTMGQRMVSWNAPAHAVVRRTANVEDLYDLKDELGSGGFSVVKRGIDRITGKEYALKIMNNAVFKKNQRHVENEVHVIAGFDHPKLVKLKEVVRTPDQFILVTELVTGGELFDKIVEVKKFPEEVARDLMYQILAAVEVLHINGVLHRDLKPENILIDSTNGQFVNIKLTDFGLAIYYDADNPISHLAGTPEYAAPEVLSRQPYGFPCDMWSMGVILYILLCGFPPFYGSSPAEVIEKVKSGSYKFPRPHWESISTQARDLVRKLLDLNPRTRLTITQVREHPWMRAGKERNTDANAAWIQAHHSFRVACHVLSAARKLYAIHEQIVLATNMGTVRETDDESLASGRNGKSFHTQATLRHANKIKLTGPFGFKKATRQSAGPALAPSTPPTTQQLLRQLDMASSQAQPVHTSSGLRNVAATTPRGYAPTTPRSARGSARPASRSVGPNSAPDVPAPTRTYSPHSSARMNGIDSPRRADQMRRDRMAPLPQVGALPMTTISDPNTRAGASKPASRRSTGSSMRTALEKLVSKKPVHAL